MKIWDWVLAALCGCWLVAMFFVAEPEPVWDWRVAAAFAQAFLSAGAIYSAWWLQSRKREADRREQERDTKATIQAASMLGEYDIAHIVSIGKAGMLRKQFAKSMSVQLKETDMILRRQNLGHLPKEAVIFALELMRAHVQLSGVMSGIADGDFKFAADDETLPASYKRYFENRTKFLLACGLAPESERLWPDKLPAWRDKAKAPRAESE